MADPFTIAATALTVGGKLIGGIAANKAGKKNRDLLYGQAQDESNAGVARELQLRSAARQQIGQQVAAQFSNGFEGGTGSALDALQESQVNAALDAMNLRQQWTNRAAALRAEGDQEASKGKSALIGSLFSAAGSALGQTEDWASAKRGTIPAGSAGGDGRPPWERNPSPIDVTYGRAAGVGF